jgi:hypothetical protein
MGSCNELAMATVSHGFMDKGSCGKPRIPWIRRDKSTYPSVTYLFNGISGLRKVDTSVPKLLGWESKVDFR